MKLFHFPSKFVKSHEVRVFSINSLRVLCNSFHTNNSILENELIELQSEQQTHLGPGILSLWRTSNKPNLKLLASKILSILASAYSFETTFFFF